MTEHATRTATAPPTRTEPAAPGGLRRAPHRAWRTTSEAVPPVKASLLRLARVQLRLAHESGTGRSALTVTGTPGTGVTQAIVALEAGAHLDHDPAVAGTAWTAQVLQGRVRLRVGDVTCFAWPGDLLVGLHGTQGLVALADSVLLVTTAHPATS